MTGKISFANGEVISNLYRLGYISLSLCEQTVQTSNCEISASEKNALEILNALENVQMLEQELSLAVPLRQKMTTLKNQNVPLSFCCL